MKDKGNSNIGHRSRLRQRFLQAGLDGFHDYEVVELLLTYAIPRRDVKPLAKKLIARFKGLRGVFDATEAELNEVPGIGDNTAVLLRLVKETAGAYLKEKVVNRTALGSPDAVLDFLTLTLSGEKVEKFLAIYMNSKNEVIAVETLHEGTLNQTVVYPRKVIEKAFGHNARSIIFVHNHPSGDATPSPMDRKLTSELERAASTVDILVHDHLIVGKNSHFSAKQAGWIRGKRGR